MPDINQPKQDDKPEGFVKHILAPFTAELVDASRTNTSPTGLTFSVKG